MKINEIISYPLLGVVIGFVLVKIQATIGFVEDRFIYILPFIFFGFLLALTKRSNISNKHKSWIQGGLWFFGLISIVAFVFWDSMFSVSILDSYQYDEQPVSHPYETSEFSQYELEYVTFQYPNNLDITTDSNGVVKLLSPEKVLWGTELRSERIYSISESQTDMNDFDLYASQYADRLQSEAVDFGLEESPMVVGEGTDKMWFLTPNYNLPSYEVQTGTRNGIPVVIEKSNFGSMCGNVYSVTFWLGGGRLVSFFTDCYGEYPYREDSETIKLITYSFQQK